MTWEQWVSIVALVLALAAVIVGVMVLRRMRARGAAAPVAEDPAEPEPDGPPRPPAFVVNPVKVPQPAQFRQIAAQICAELGLPEPLWFTTTVHDPGVGQAQQALDRGASVVVAVGGDGTVRAVATALAGSSVPMGLVPMGTGNLLARNLDLPMDGSRLLIHTALTGAEHPMDVGWIRPRALLSAEETGSAEAGGQPDGGAADGPAGQQGGAAHGAEPTAGDGVQAAGAGVQAAGAGVQAAGAGVQATGDDGEPAGSAEKEPPDTLARRGEHVFLVIGGFGFDAAMVAGAHADLKKRMGWFAYFVAGVRNLRGRKIRVRMQIGDAPWQRLRLRTLLFANCGRLPGGLVLFPDAEIDDGWLDMAAIDTRQGLLGWVSLFGKVIGQGMGFRKDLPGDPASITFWRGRDVHVRLEAPEQLQVDGDLIGEAQALSVRVDHQALIMRVRA